MVSNTPAIEESLKSRLKDLQQRLVSVEKDQKQPHSSDSSEQAQERENDEVIDAIGEETRAAIAEINAALQRLADGRYGDCQHCGEPIAPGRLEARPEATDCINCAD